MPPGEKELLWRGVCNVSIKPSRRIAAASSGLCVCPARRQAMRNRRRPDVVSACAEGERCFLPFSVFHQRLTRVLHNSGRSPTFLICWRSTFPAVPGYWFSDAGSAAAGDRQLAFQAVDDNLLGSIMIVTLIRCSAIATCKAT